MSSSSSSRPSGRDFARTPSVTRSASQQAPTSEGTPYTPVEPKSKLLQGALNARRARDDVATPTPTPTPTRSKASAGSRDTWCQLAAEEEPAPITKPIRTPIGNATMTRAEMDQREAARRRMEGLGMKIATLEDGNRQLAQQLAALKPYKTIIYKLEEKLDYMQGRIKSLDKNLQLEKDGKLELNRIIQALTKENERQGASFVENAEALEEAADTIVTQQQEIVELREKILKLEALLGQSQATDVDRSYKHTDGQVDSGYYSQSDAVQTKLKSSKNIGVSMKEKAKKYKRESIVYRESVGDLNKQWEELARKDKERWIQVSSPTIEEEGDRQPERSVSSWRPQHRDTPRPDTPIPHSGEHSGGRSKNISHSGERSKKKFHRLHAIQTDFDNFRTPKSPSEPIARVQDLSFKGRKDWMDKSSDHRSVSSRTASSSQCAGRAPSSNHAARRPSEQHPKSPEVESIKDRDSHMSYETERTNDRDSYASYETESVISDPNASPEWPIPPSPLDYSTYEEANPNNRFATHPQYSSAEQALDKAARKGQGWRK